jgi:hypothetical protein
MIMNSNFSIINTINAFVQLGKVMQLLSKNSEYKDFSGLTEDEFSNANRLIERQQHYNGWFTEDMVRKAMGGIAEWLTISNLGEFSAKYNSTKVSKKVAIIMAGNIPLVGFHDFLCTLLSGHTAVCKLSSDDKTLLPKMYEYLCLFEPSLIGRVEFSEYKMKDFDAVIATGSNNSFNYFEQYFGKYPNLFRKNRTSVAILNGNESNEELSKIGLDFFTFYGLGCRNVSHVLLPSGYKIDTLFESIISYSEIVNHHKYANNYDYQRSIMMLSKIPFLENNFVIFKEDEHLVSPLAQINYSFYQNEEEKKTFLAKHEESIQAIVGEGYIPFGEAQKPKLKDFADGVDTMLWLSLL